MKAFVSKRASRAAERINTRWREHADDPGIFAHEFLEAIELLESSNVPGSPFLRKSRCHLYFEIDDASQRIQILHVWDGRRERVPKLRMCLRSRARALRASS